MPRPITPATYNDVTCIDPSTASAGKVKRARRVAARAKAIIEDKGWTQHTGISDTGGRCLSQALAEARQVKSKPGLVRLDSVKFSPFVAGILEEARPKITRRAASISSIGAVSWNDRPGRTVQQVLALLEAAANG